MEKIVLQKSSDKPFKWLVTNTEENIVVEFESHKFDETRQVTFIDDVQETDAEKLAALMHEIGEWLHSNAYFIAMPLRDENDVNAYIGQQISCARLAKGWSGYRLAKVSGLTATHISKIENAIVGPGVQMLYKIASALGTDFDIL